MSKNSLSGKWCERSCTSFLTHQNWLASSVGAAGKPLSFTGRFQTVSSLETKSVAESVLFPVSLLRFVTGKMPRQTQSIFQVPNESHRPFIHLKSVLLFFPLPWRKRRISSCHMHAHIIVNGRAASRNCANHFLPRRKENWAKWRL